MTEKMSIVEFVTECIKYGINFEVTHYERDAFDEYCLHIILGHHEHIVPCYDEHRLAKLWYKDILEYYIY